MQDLYAARTSMTDDVLINKAATIERCLRRAQEEYRREPATFAANLSRQDAAICNILRACEAALDMGQGAINIDVRREDRSLTRHGLRDWQPMP
jgi:hypothetical protein